MEGMFNWDQSFENMMSNVGEIKMSDIDVIKINKENFEEGLEKKYVTVYQDKFYSYSTFVTDFASPEMKVDMPLILRAFIEHEGENLSKYSEIQYWQYKRGSVPPYEEACCQVKNLLFNAYKMGSNFARQYWINLCKFYRKDIYKDLKKYKKISFDDVIILIDDHESDFRDLMITAAIYLTMAEIMNIEIDDDCASLYYTLSMFHKDRIEGTEEITKGYPFEDEEIEKAENFWEEYYREYGKPEKIDNASIRGYKNSKYARKIVEKMFEKDGYGYDFSEVARLRERPTSDYLEIAALIANRAYSSKEFAYEDLEIYAEICNLVEAYVESSWDISRFFDMLLGTTAPGMERREKTSYLFDESIVPSAENINKQDVVKKDKPKSVDEKEELSKIEELIKELDNVREQLHKKENELKYLSDLYRQKNMQESKYDLIKAKYELEHEELSKLRSFAYSLTDEELPGGNFDYENAKKELAVKDIVIIGGHINWVSKLKESFKDWTFISPGSISDKNISIIKKADYVYIFTDCLSHKTYYKYVGILRSHKKDFGYINSVNIEKNIMQIYNDVISNC